MTKPSAHRADVELAWAQKCLGDAGVDSPRADAEWLMVAILGIDRGRLVTVDALESDQRDRFRAAVARRAGRIPLQHIIGTTAFGPTELAVGPGVFTPRPETEFLAEWAVGCLGAAGGDAASVVDLCSGSGALAIAVATMAPTAHVRAVEKSAEALKWLRRNVESAPADVRRRISVLAADVTDRSVMRDEIYPGTVDVVVTNPPYVPELVEVSPEVAHDPAEAVFAGPDGMSVIRPMLPVVADLLRPDGVVGIEHDESTSDLVVSAVESTGLFVEVRAHRDLAGRPRFVTARRNSSALSGRCDTGVGDHGRMAG